MIPFMICAGLCALNVFAALGSKGLTPSRFNAAVAVWCALFAIWFILHPGT